MYTTIISAAALQELMHQKRPVMVFDCSFELTQPLAGEAQYRQSHIVGAVRADLERHLSAPPSTADAASGGRHPLPSREHFARWLGSVGLGADTQVVVYDRQGCNYCARLWWMLKWVGHEAVAVLDGGWDAWLAVHGATQAGTESPVGTSTSTPSGTGNFALKPALTALATTEMIANGLGKPSQVLVDARGAARYRGEVEPLDPVAGHIPGALNRPFTQNFDGQGRFKPAAQLRQEFEALLAGRDPRMVTHHCGSGVSAVPNIIAMELAGWPGTALYAGSWSEWCSDPTRVAAQG